MSSDEDDDELQVMYLPCGDTGYYRKFFVRNQYSRPEKTKRPQKEGSTHLPKIPVVKLRKPPISTKKGIIDWSDVAILRKELKDKVYHDDQKKRYRSDYIRTSQDFYRMEMDKLRSGNPKTLDNMKVCCKVYLGTSLGSSKAIRDLAKVLRAERQRPVTQQPLSQPPPEKERKIKHEEETEDEEPSDEEKQPDPEPERTTDDTKEEEEE
ncbi:uncharacterized protein LOC118431799 isoform X1 [Branchiostoma floridae]|uniref:Uncharacterized protein LOC118431799 isoform X1 n=1 Tax=Branchiostoma floridae TaxID=7739 RepID=A0A9J7MDZ0_BRAFL|nr:uncharacterized protein LOC118431799 isoform X1 [Branchiostoma floridae]